MNTACRTRRVVNTSVFVGDVCMSHVTGMKESYRTDEGVMSHVCMSHVVGVHTLCHA